jgi:hypothetical protein
VASVPPGKVFFFFFFFFFSPFFLRDFFFFFALDLTHARIPPTTPMAGIEGRGGSRSFLRTVLLPRRGGLPDHRDTTCTHGALVAPVRAQLVRAPVPALATATRAVCATAAGPRLNLAAAAAAAAAALRVVAAVLGSERRGGHRGPRISRPLRGHQRHRPRPLPWRRRSR